MGGDQLQAGGADMMHAEKKRMAAAFVGGAVPAKEAPATGGGEGPARIAAAG